MKKIYLTITSNLLIANLNAQNFEWTKREGLWAYDYGNGIATDTLGNVYVAGKYEMNADFSGILLPDHGNHDSYLAKYTSSGDLVWITTAGGPLGDYAQALYCDGSYLYIAGEIEGYGNSIYFDSSTVTLTCIGDNDVFLAKYDLDGNLLWARSAGGDYNDKAMGIAADNNGNVFICGLYENNATFGGIAITGHGGKDIFLAKYDSLGNFQWVKHAGSTGRDEAKSVKCDADGNVYITGMHADNALFESTTLASSNGYVNLFLAKYAPDGNLIWVKSAGSDYDDVGWSLTMDTVGKIYITGEYNAYALFDTIPLITTGQTEIFIVCYDTSGNALWAQSAGGQLIDRARGIGCDGSNLYITGQFSLTATFGSYTLAGVDSSEIFMAKLSNTGDFEWAIAVSGVADSIELLSYESGNAICSDAYGNIYATGALLAGGVFGNDTITPYSRTDVFITKITQGTDTIAPTVVNYNPPDNAFNIPGNTDLTITFNKNIQKGTGNILIKEGGIVTQTVDVAGANVTIANNIVTIDADDFTPNALVNIEMAAGVFKDMANNNYLGINDSTTWNFTVADTPVVINYNPPDNAINIPGNADLTITFNKNIQKGTGNILIKEGGIVTQTVDVAGANVTIANNIVTIDADDFTPNALVNIEMVAGVFKDTANNNYLGINDSTTWNFTIDIPTTIKEYIANENYTIYPNPGTGIFTLNLNNTDTKNIKITITNCFGQIANKELYKTSSEFVINLSTQAKGIYFVEIMTADLIKIRKKIVVQ